MSNLKESFIPKLTAENMKFTLQRFPITLLYMTMFIVFLDVIVSCDIPAKLSCTMLFYFATGSIADLVISLWTENQTNKRRAVIIKTLSLSLLTAYYFGFMYFGFDNWINSPAALSANISIIVALILFIPLVKYSKDDSESQSWLFLTRLIRSFIMFSLFSIILLVAIILFMFAIEELFTVNRVVWNKIEPSFVILPYWFIGFGFLCSVPKDEEQDEEIVASISRLINPVVKYILLPFLASYILLMSAYTLKILFTWELPHGNLSWLVSAVMAIFVCCYIALHSQMQTNNTLKKLMCRVIPICLLPLFVLMTVGIIRRYIDYGLTAPRLYMLTALVWYYAVILVILFSKTIRFRWILSSFAIIFLLTSAQPLNYNTISERILIYQLRYQLDKNDISCPLTEIRDNDKINNLEADIRNEIYDRESYIRRTYGADALGKGYQPAPKEPYQDDSYNNTTDGTEEPMYDNHIQSQTTNNLPTGIKTTYTYAIKEQIYPIWITPEGRCYVIRISEDGSKYGQYLDEEICRQICAELNIDYKE